MRFLIQKGYSFIDYEGDTENCKRSGEGVQDWPDFGRFEGHFSKNRIHGKGKFTTKRFPYSVSGFFEDNNLVEGKIEIDEGAIIYEGTLGENFQLKSGILSFKENAQLHLIFERDKIEQFEFFVNGSQIDRQQFTEDNVFSYKFDSPRKSHFKLNLSSNELSYNYSLIGSSENASRSLSIDLAVNSFRLYNFRNGSSHGPQLELSLSAQRSVVKSTYVLQGQKVNLLIADASGKVIRREGKENRALLNFKGSDSYFVGGLNSKDELKGPASLIMDGKCAVNCELSEKGVSFPRAVDLLKAIEQMRQQTLGEIDTDELNGFSEYAYPSGLVYRGYFLNGFVYCHKDSLPSCLTTVEARRFDFEDLMSRAKTFEGMIDDLKVVGQAKIRYKAGEIYSGPLNDRLQREGDGLQLEPSGRLYFGEFAKDMYNGLGKLIEGKSFTMGYFRDGQLKIGFDIDGLNAQTLNMLRTTLSANKDKDIDEEQIKALIDQKNFSAQIGEEERQRKADEEEIIASLKLAEDQQKRLKEEQKLLDELARKVVMKTIFAFKNKYSYHGRVVGNYIVDRDEGDIIDPSGLRIPVMYRVIGDADVGTFKSKDGKHVFMFRYSVKTLAHIEIDLNAPKDETPNFQ